jgi:hypothetical protein
MLNSHGNNSIPLGSTFFTSNLSYFYLKLKYDSRFPKETGVDRTRRHCSVETIRDTGPIEIRCPGRCPKIRLKEPGLNETSAGFQTDENRYYTLILAEKAEKR